jgi:hypothetical protein
MANDFQKREPTKNEKMIYELFIQQQGLERSLFTNSSLLVSLAMLLNIEPEKLAAALLDNDKIKDYSTRLNSEIGKLEKEKHPEHSHEGHDHEGHNHKHGESQAESPKAEESK